MTAHLKGLGQRLGRRWCSRQLLPAVAPKLLDWPGAGSLKYFNWYVHEQISFVGNDKWRQDESWDIAMRRIVAEETYWFSMEYRNKFIVQHPPRIHWSRYIMNWIVTDCVVLVHTSFERAILVTTLYLLPHRICIHTTTLLLSLGAEGGGYIRSWVPKIDHSVSMKLTKLFSQLLFRFLVLAASSRSNRGQPAYYVRRCTCTTHPMAAHTTHPLLSFYCTKRCQTISTGFA